MAYITALKWVEKGTYAVLMFPNYDNMASEFLSKYLLKQYKEIWLLGIVICVYLHKQWNIMPALNLDLFLAFPVGYVKEQADVQLGK